MRHLIICLLAILLPLQAYSLPAEDHWNSEIDPALKARLQQAQGLIDEKKFASALPILQDLAKTLPANADVFNLLGFAYRHTGELTKSAVAYERSLYLDPNHMGALEYQGELFLMNGDIAAAERNLARLETLCSSHCEEKDELAEAIDAWRAKNAK